MGIIEKMRPALERVGRALLVSAIVVVFSEKLYWYVTGYDVVELILGYFFPAYVLLWVIDAFRVRWAAPLFLAAAVFGFITEGVLVGTIYEGGPLGLFSASYTPLAWHAPLSVMFGWWWLGRRLAAGSLRGLVAAAAGVGVLWGLWALAWWLPENVADPALLAQGARLGRWPTTDFAAHAFTFTALLVAAHGLLGRMRPAAFVPSRVELALVGGGLLFFFVGVLSAVPWAPLKLVPLLALTLAALVANRRREPPGSLLEDRSGPARPAALLALFVMPAAAVAIYAAAAALDPPVAVIYAITAYGGVLATGVAGWMVYAVAWVRTMLGGERVKREADSRR